MRGWTRKAARAAEAFRRGGVHGLASLVGQRLGELRTQHTRTLRRATRNAVEFGIRRHLLRGRVAHVHGPEQVGYGADQLLLLCVVRNGGPYVTSFMAHYEALGVTHYVFLDNGSTDDTIARLCAYPRVTMLRSDAPYAQYENTMKRYLAERFSPGRWNLCADIDELFDYPSSDQLPLSGFLRYLNANGYTAVVAQMLDMFSDAPLTALNSAPDARLKEQYPLYDLSAIERRSYDWSTPFRPEIKMHWGGVRRRVFGTNNGLTKAPLVRMDGRVRPFVEWHQATGAVLADTTCVLMHYPFVSTFRDKVDDAVRTGRYGMTTTDEYVAYARGLAGMPQLTLTGPAVQRFTSVNALVAQGFLVISEEYRRWVESYATHRDGPHPALR